jgi:hypothetical protein
MFGPTVFPWGPTAHMWFGDAAPTLPAEGNFVVGDIVINTAPAAGGASPFAWVCTTAGAGGTAVFTTLTLN